MRLARFYFYGGLLLFASTLGAQTADPKGAQSAGTREVSPAYDARLRGDQSAGTREVSPAHDARLRADAEKEADETPFGPVDADKKENIFGNKAEKDAIWKKMEYQIGFIAEGAGFNNTDLRRLDESTSAAVQNTDDKQTLAFSRLYFNFYWPLTDDLSFRFDLFKNGFWGNDQLAGQSTNNISSSTTRGADPLNFGELNLKYRIFSNDSHQLSTKLGRQFFEIGGETYDYFFKDYVDALTFRYSRTGVGAFRVLAIDAWQLGADPTTHANYVRFFSHDNDRLSFYDGDVNVLRSGFVYDSLNLLQWKDSGNAETALTNKLYAFGARYGATNRGGADRAPPGTPGNFADNDYTMLFGTRFLYQMPVKGAQLKSFADAALSTGLDRRLPTAAGENQDADTNGYAFAAGGTLDISQIADLFDLDFSTDGFYASGAKYNANGDQTSLGFTSLKGSRAGGLILSRFYGLRPSNFTDYTGFSNSPHDYERRAPTAFAHAGVGTTFWKKLRIAFDWWLAFDTSKSELYENARANGSSSTITNTVFKAQDRLGKILGQEIDLSIDFAVNQFWTLYSRAGIFLPGAFYQTPGIAAGVPYGSDTAVGLQLGSKLVF